jgi:hypothetical protein
MDLDVLLPFHRIDKYFEAALYSLIKCKGVKLNLIAIDDRPDQGMDASYLFKDFKHRTLVSTGGGKGYGKALEIGSGMLSAPHTALFNSDDLIDPLRFKLQLEALTNSELCITKMARISKNGNRSSSLSGSIKSRNFHPVFLLLGSYGADATWCMRKEWWINNSFFDDYDCLDWRIALSAFQKSEIALINKPLYFYRRHPGQLTSNRKLDKVSMSPVYEKWSNYAQSLSVTKNSESVFQAIACPWLRGEPVTSGNLRAWINQFCEFGKTLDDEIQRNIIEILKRRYFFAALNSQNSLRSRLALAKMGSSALLPLIKDALF